MKCLVIDDDSFARELVVVMLKDLAVCEQAGSGAEGVAKFSASLAGGDPYDLLLLDILMPDMNGHETAKVIRSIEKEHGLDINQRANIIMLTALNDHMEAMKAFCSAQSAAYLVKPVSKENLLKSLSKLGLLEKQ